MINLYDTWDGESLSAVRELIQKELRKAFNNVSTSVSNGKVTLTFNKGDGTTTTAVFTAAESSGDEGYNADLRLSATQNVYSAGLAVLFSYNFTLTLDGEEVYNITPTITLSAYTVDSGNNPSKLLWLEIHNTVGIKNITIPASTFDGIEGNILIKGEYYVLYQGLDYTGTRNKLISIATCSLDFAAGFNLTTQVKGYTNTSSMNEVYLNYIGTYNSNLLIYIDGVLRGTLTDVISGSLPEITFAMNSTDESGETILTDGLHTCQIVALMNTGLVDSNGDTLYIYSNSILFDFYKGLLGNHIGVLLTLNTPDIIESPVTTLILNTELYVNTTIKYAASSYITNSGTYNESTTVSVNKGSTNINSLSVGPTEVFEYTFRDVEIPDKLSDVDAHYFYNFAVTAGSRKVYINIDKNSSGVSVASGANIDLTASGRSNLESANKRVVWDFTDNKGASYLGTLSNFTFANADDTQVDGWTGESLKFCGNTILSIPYAPFLNFNTNTGYYIEFNIKVNTILDSDTYILSAFNSDNNGGFYLKAEEAGMITTSGNTVSTPIAAGSKYNIGFLIKKYTGTDSTNNTITTILLELFVNGIRSGVVVFNANDSFASDAIIQMNGNGAIWEFYGMRTYNTTLSSYAIYNNYLTTLLSGEEIVAQSTKNDLLNTAKTAVDFEKLRLKNKNILVVEVGDGNEECAIDSSDYLGKLVSELEGTALETWKVATKDQFLNPSAQKKANYIVKSLKYYHEGNINNKYSFQTGPTLMQVLGTSSTYYSRKNYDIFFTGQKYDKKSSLAKWTSSFISGESTDGKNTTQPMYSMGPNDLGVPCVCLKADYSDSSNLHNTQLTRLVNDVWLSLGENYMTPPQHNNDTIYDEIRVGVNGHPIDVFVLEGSEYTYIGKYNMNNEKKDSHHVFGFDGTSGNTAVGTGLCIEFLENNKPATLFDAGEDFDWTTCASTTDSDGEGIPELEFRYNSEGGGDWVDATTQEKNIAKRPFIWVKECYDDWKNSYNEDTGEYTSSKFVEELTLYFNPYNLVSWYLYTEYFLAVDQRSKNMMLASWGATETSGIWYFLPYDGDTALGGTNDGWLIIPWDSDENTLNPMSPSMYVYMGHDSRLWELVRFYLYDTTYTSIASYGLSGCSMVEIANVLRNESTTDTRFNLVTINKYLKDSRNYWADMLYNFDAETKYIAPLTWLSGRGSKSDFAQFVQGARDAHRDWLINKRFRMLDSKYRCGFFLSDSKGIKFDKAEGIEASIKVIAAYKTYININTDGKVRTEINLDAGVQGALTTSVKFDSTTGANIQGLYAIEELDFDTMAPYWFAQPEFPNYPNLKRLIASCPNYDGVLTADVSTMTKFLPNLREFTLKGYPNVTGILDLSNNIMLERLDVDCEGLSGIVLPYSTFNIKYFNASNLNETIPWEFWDELNEYYWRNSDSCIVVGELIEGDGLTYGFKASVDNSTLILVNLKYFVQILPLGTLYGLGRYSKNVGFFGSTTGQSSRNPSNLKGILYAKIDYSRLKETMLCDGGYTVYLFNNCANLEYVNTRGWKMKIDENLYTSSYGDALAYFANSFTKCAKLKSFDFSFLDTTPGYYRNNSTIANTLAYYHRTSSTSTLGIADSTLTSIEYVKYGPNYFNSQLETDWSTVSSEYPLAIATQSTLNMQTFIDLAEDLPDISGRTFNSVLNKTLNFGEVNYNDYTRFPQSARDKITAKGWIIAI